MRNNGENNTSRIQTIMERKQIDEIDFLLFHSKNKLSMNELTVILGKIEQISIKRINEPSILKKLLDFMNEIMTLYYVSSTPEKSMIVYIKECIYKVVNKITLACTYDDENTRNFNFDNFILKIFSVSLENENESHMNSFHIKVNFKDSNLAIQSPLTLFLFKRKLFKDNLKQVFLFQTIVWKAHSGNALSNIFSLEIFDKNTKQKLELLNFAVFAFKILMPESNKLKYSDISLDNGFQCQLWNKTLHKWQNKGCKFKGFNIRTKKYICLCNKLGEFRVTSKRKGLLSRILQNSTNLTAVTIYSKTRVNLILHFIFEIIVR